MAWSYNHKTKQKFWTEDPKYIPETEQGIMNTGYGWKDMTTGSNVEYLTQEELLRAREEEIMKRQMKRNKVEAEQAAFDESYRWAKNTLTKEEKDLQEQIKKAEDALRRNPNNKQIQGFYTQQRNSLQSRLNTSIGKRALKYREGKENR